VRPSVQRIFDTMTGDAAFLRDGRLDILPTSAPRCPRSSRASRPSGVRRWSG